MGARGRTSAAAQTVVVGGFGQRPAPPSELTKEQAAVWLAVTASEGPDFFRTAALRGLLVDYCRHTVTARFLSERIEAFEAEWLKEEGGVKAYGDLLKMRDRETKASSDKATKLRLTNQSRYTPQAAATAAKHAGSERKPWEVA